MFLLRAGLLIAIAFLFTADANAQLFRFRRSAPPRQRPSTYNSQAYQYTPLQRPVTSVPSQRNADATTNSQSTVVYIPANSLTPAQRQAQSGQMVTLTVQDPQTRRWTQQQFVKTTIDQLKKQTPKQPTEKEQPARVAAKDKEESPSAPILEKLPEESIAKASSTELNLPILDAPEMKSVAQTSFESKAKATDSETQYSIFEVEGNKKTEPPTQAGNSVLDSKLPILDAPVAKPIRKERSDTQKLESKNLDIDLPPLNVEASK